MKKHLFSLRKFETAQILPIVAIGMFAIIGLAAILLDGGVLMANRRAAQAAADAGALAGAHLSCQHADPSTIVAKAREYAVDLNGADPSTTASYNPTTGLVTVEAKMEQNSWFARIFGEDTLSTGASASAGCFYPSAASRLLPLAFYWETPPVKAHDRDCETEDCTLVNWDFTSLMNTLTATSVTNLPLDDIYIVADKIKVCEKGTGEIVCSEVSGNALGGDRQWLDLSEIDNGPLSKIIQNGLSEPLYTPALINGDSGVVSGALNGAIFSGLDPIPGYTTYSARLVYVPLFDQLCDPGGSCLGDGINDYMKDSSKPAYRLVGFAPFVLTCVQKGPKCEFGNCIPKNTYPNTTNKAICPGYLASGGTANGDNAVEGYFVDGLPADMYSWGTGGVDGGIYFISLSD